MTACIGGDDESTATVIAGVPPPTPTLTPTDPELLANLRELAIPFETAEPESGFSDLEPLRNLLGDARIVALGEATHGTSEFFKMKHRLIEFLVTEMDFTIFAIEAPWPATKQINRYVYGADATQDEILDGLTFWTWQTQEVIDLIEWMRAYNARPGVDPVSFQAFDMQISLSGHAVDQVLAFVGEVEPTAVGRFEEYYAARSIDGAQDALDDLLAHRDRYKHTPSTESFEAIVQTARMVVQDQELEAVLRSSDADRFVEGYELRDRYMAENVTWLLDQAGAEAKAILWAHNGHVMASKGSSPGGTTTQGMGVHLRERYGDDLKVVGFDLFSGTFIARGQSSGGVPPAMNMWLHKIPSPPPENIEYTFAQLESPRFMLDLQSIEADTLAGDWLHDVLPMWSIGSEFDVAKPEIHRAFLNLPKAFDVLIYFHETHASHRLTAPAPNFSLAPMMLRD